MKAMEAAPVQKNKKLGIDGVIARLAFYSSCSESSGPSRPTFGQRFQSRQWGTPSCQGTSGMQDEGPLIGRS